ncbi:glutamate--tRNA ligase [Hydrogenimonas sp.]
MLRFAARPTGDMTIEELRIALVTYLFAKQRNEKFLVRIDDIERDRIVEGKDREILEILELCGIRYDDVAYQSANLTIHQHMAIKLLQSRRAFACFCTPEKLEADRRDAEKAGRPYRYGGRCEGLSDAEVLANENPFTVRFKKPDHPIRFDDLLLGERQAAPEEIDSFVIMEADKRPTETFASAIDDMLHDVSLVVAEARHIDEAPRQVAVREALGYDKAIGYAHLPAILGEPHPLTVRRLVEEGFVPEAIANYLLLLGFETPKEFFTLDEAAEWFDLTALSPEPVRFDYRKLRSLNREHMRRMESKSLSRAFGFADAAVGDLAKCYLTEASTIAEIRPKIAAVFAPKPFGNEHGEAMRTLRAALKEAPPMESYEAFTSFLTQKTGLSGEALEKPLRLLLTGASEGPELGSLYPHLTSYLQEIVQ